MKKIHVREVRGIKKDWFYEKVVSSAGFIVPEGTPRFTRSIPRKNGYLSRRFSRSGRLIKNTGSIDFCFLLISISEEQTIPEKKRFTESLSDPLSNNYANRNICVLM